MTFENFTEKMTAFARERGFLNPQFKSEDGRHEMTIKGGKDDWFDSVSYHNYESRPSIFGEINHNRHLFKVSVEG